MVRLLRFALICLLALALPAQGYAANTMLSCGKTPQHAAHPAQGHDRAAMTAHHHTAFPDEAGAHGADQQSAASGIERDDGIADVQVGKTVGGKCSVCAACCSVAAIAMTMLAFDVVPVAADFGVTALEPRDGVTSGCLERPPRIVHA